MGLATRKFEIDAASSLMGWWRDAGVDTAIAETPHDWLGAMAATPAARRPAAAAPHVELPRSLDALVEHLATADLADAGAPARRLRPAGDRASDLMILVDHPDPADVDTGQLLSDPIFDKMLGAIGRDRSSVYIAALCPGRPLTGRLSAEAGDGFGLLAKQHIALISPLRLWLVGGAASRAILGIDDAAAKGKLHRVNLAGTMMDAIATAHPRMFAESKARKAAAWAEMQRLIVKDDA